MSIPIKEGWLLKKKDMLQGWDRRYIKVYQTGKMEYYVGK